MRMGRILFRQITFAVAMLCLVMISPVLKAQSTTDGAISGTVTDPSGAGVASAVVTVTNSATSAEQTTTTDDNGYFRVAKLQPSAYVVKIEVSGFALFTAEKVIVQVGSVTDLPAKLNLADRKSVV